jgi:hypothetical protein
VDELVEVKNGGGRNGGSAGAGTAGGSAGAGTAGGSAGAGTAGGSAGGSRTDDDDVVDECADVSITQYVKRIALLQYIIDNGLENIENVAKKKFTPQEIATNTCGELGITKNNITKNFTILGLEAHVTTMLQKIKNDYKLNDTGKNQKDYGRDKLVVEIFKLVAQIVALSVKITKQIDTAGAASGAGAVPAAVPAGGGAGTGGTATGGTGAGAGGAGTGTAATATGGTGTGAGGTGTGAGTGGAGAAAAAAAGTPTLEDLKTQIDDIVAQEKARLKSIEGKTTPSTDGKLTEIIKLIDAELNKMKNLETQVNTILASARPSP